MTIKTTLPTDSTARKGVPLFSGVRRYAPAAFMLMAETSKAGNDKHNPGQPLHHARGKSTDHGDCIDRHMSDVQDIEAALERGAERSPENLKQLREELGQLMWRTALYVQEAAEKYLGAPLAPGARLPAPPPDLGQCRSTTPGFRWTGERLEAHGEVRCGLVDGHSGKHSNGSSSW